MNNENIKLKTCKPYVMSVWKKNPEKHGSWENPYRDKIKVRDENESS